MRRTQNNHARKSPCSTVQLSAVSSPRRENLKSPRDSVLPRRALYETASPGAIRHVWALKIIAGSGGMHNHLAAPTDQLSADC